MLDISVIIPTYNRSELLLRTMQSVINQQYPTDRFEIIVVDNGSSDNTRDIVADFIVEYPGIKYFCEQDMGLHNARHSGAKTAKGDILLYVDDDIIADSNLFSEIIKPYSDPDVGCVGGKILPKWEVEPPDWIKRFPKWYLSILDDEDGPKEVEWIYGCNFSIRKNLLFEAGGFNPDAFGDKKMWWYRGDGEIGLLRKIHAAGKKVIYNPNAVVWHCIPQKRLTVAYFKERAFKSGLEASFSQYRYHHNGSFNPLKMIFRASVFGIYFIVHSLLGRFDSVVHKVLASHYKARFFYELKLMKDEDLQRFINKSAYYNFQNLLRDVQQNHLQ
jgi:glucosyl-dolichyl phosphate glucuronosyltransferase